MYIDLYFDSLSFPAACIVFGDMAIVSLFLLLLFCQFQILSGKVQARSFDHPIAPRTSAAFGTGQDKHNKYRT